MERRAWKPCELAAGTAVALRSAGPPACEFRRLPARFGGTFRMGPLSASGVLWGRSTPPHLEAENFSRLALGKDFNRAATDFAVCGETL